MKGEDIHSWLEDQIEQLITMPQFHENKSDMASEAFELRENAQADGISLADLTAACEGDIEEYLLRKQNGYTSDEIVRKTAKG